MLWARNAKVFKGFEGDNQGDGGAEVLAEEGAKRDVFPFLDVSGGPIIEDDQAKDVVLRLGRSDALTERLAVKRDEAISSSKSSRREGPKTGGASGSGRVWPMGRRMGVPLTTMLEARPWYPTGMCFQLGSRALSGSRNILPISGVVLVE